MSLSISASNPHPISRRFTKNWQSTRFCFSKRRAQATTAATNRTLPFHEWLNGTTPTWTWDWPYQVEILKRLYNLDIPEQKRKLALFLPPRHGKSEMVTVRYAAWRLVIAPETRVVIAAYGQTLAEKFSRKVRRLVQDQIGLSPERTAANDWETVAGGGLRAVGLGAGITGQGFDLLIVDDPVKSREEAESETYRERAWEWYTDDLYTRQEPGAAIVLIQTRWHQDDLSGRILASEMAGEWEVLSLPALAEEGDPLGRNPGSALCPERYDEAALARIRQTLGEYSWQALYQQHPTGREGALFKVSQFQIVDAPPAGMREWRAWDEASTPSGGDWTAGVRIGMLGDGLFYVIDVQRGQWDPDERNRIERQTAELDGQHVRIHGPQDPGAAGKDRAMAFTRNLAGFAVKTEPVSGDKVVRADPFAAQVNAGNVRLLRGDWNRAFIEELRTFPLGKHDDQVDAAADAFNELCSRRVARVGVS